MTAADWLVLGVLLAISVALMFTKPPIDLGEAEQPRPDDRDVFELMKSARLR